MKFLDYIFAARPMLLMPVWTVFLVTLRYHHQLAGKTFSLTDFMILVGLTFLAAGAFYINQVFDYESDQINRKIGYLQRRLITSNWMLNAFLILSLAALAISYFISLTTFLIFLQLFVLGYIYSAPPIRLKDRPLGGLLTNAYAHGWLVAISIMPELTQHNAGLLGWDNPFYFFLTVGAVYCLTTIPDRVGDEATGKKTIAVKLGDRGAAVMAITWLLVAFVLALNYNFMALAALALLTVLLIVIALIVRKDTLYLIAAKLPLFLLTLLAGYFYPIYLLFIVALILATRIYYKKRFNMIYPRLN